MAKWLLEPVERWLWVFGVRFGMILCGKSDTPSQPDPYTTAAAQTQQNKDTAQYNAQLNRINQYTPLGSLTYSQTPTFDQQGYDQALAKYYEDLNTWNATQGGQPQQKKAQLVNGKVTWTGGDFGQASTPKPVAPDKANYQSGDPTWSSTVTLDPKVQKVFDQQLANQASMADLAGSMMPQVQSMLGQPLESIDQATIQDAIMSRLRAQFDRDEEALRSRLANMGITSGSDAWNTEFTNFGQQKNDAEIQALLSAQDYASKNLQNQQMQRSIPLNEMLALQGGTQVQLPQFSQGGQSQAGTTNISDLIMQGYQGDVANANAQAAQEQQAASAVASLAMLGILASDQRIKEDIKPVGTTFGGTPIYTYKYKSGDPRYFMGVMAQDVEKTNPDAVVEVGGIKGVNYGAL